MTDQQTQGATILRKALTDQAFRQRLKSDPAAALKEHGITVPEGVTVQVHEADATTAHLIVPALPTGKAADELSEAELAQLAGGTGVLGGNVLQVPINHPH